MINGERIKQVRELNGLTQKKFSEFLGVNQSAIAQIESGRTSPSDAVLERIIFKMDFPISFFKQPNSTEFPLGSLLFRARLSLTLSEKSQIRQYARIAYEMIQKMGKNINQIPLRLPRIDDDPINAAIKTRSVMGLSPDTPIQNLIQTLEKNGVIVLALPIEFKKIDAFSLWINDQTPRAIIAFSSHNISGDRLRFSVAHELGHLVIHQTMTGNNKKFDKESDLFAGEFLMPKDAMMNEIITPVTLDVLLPLKKRWGVSIQALVRRAATLQIITVRQYQYLMHQIGSYGYRKNEPIEIVIEKPRMLSQMAEMLYGNPINYNKLSSDLDMPRRLAKSIIESHLIKTAIDESETKKGNGQVITLYE
jgi:Zn-dependent peptidase ImmA (M78 family)/DNA-binding XRE family transcriptional regulator